MELVSAAAMVESLREAERFGLVVESVPNAKVMMERLGKISVANCSIAFAGWTASVVNPDC
jgi:hypothetical protein